MTNSHKSCTKVGPSGPVGVTGPNGATGAQGPTASLGLQVYTIDEISPPLTGASFTFSDSLIGTLLVYGGESGPGGNTGLAVGTEATASGSFVGTLAFRFVDGGALFDSDVLYV